MERFLESVERRAFTMARIATGNSEDAHDIVQDAMLGLVRKYSSRSEEEWRPLFFTILQSRIMDWHRRSRIRNGLLARFLGAGKDEKGLMEDPLSFIAAPKRDQPVERLLEKDSFTALEKAIHSLTVRQQQAFLLRAWEGLSVAETAKIMRCSEGSVKTHYSRAVHTLRETLEGHLP